MIVLAVLALAVVSSSALPRPEGRGNDDTDRFQVYSDDDNCQITRWKLRAGLPKGQPEHFQHASAADSNQQAAELVARRSLDSLGGGNLLRHVSDINGDKLFGGAGGEGKQRVRQLDTLGNGNLIRRTLMDFESPTVMEHGGNPLGVPGGGGGGGGWLLLKAAYPEKTGYTDDDVPFFYVIKPGELDSLYNRLYNRRLTRNMNLDSLEGYTFGASKRFDTLNGEGFGSQKRNMDEIDHVGFNSFVKRPMDEIDRVGFTSFVKRPMDEIDKVGFDRFVKRPMDEIDHVGFNRFVKRH